MISFESNGLLVLVRGGGLPRVIIPGWREIAWRNAERLASASSDEERAEVAAGIEAYAASQAETIRLASGYGPLRNSAARDAYCSIHHG